MIVHFILLCCFINSSVFTSDEYSLMHSSQGEDLLDKSEFVTERVNHQGSIVGWLENVRQASLDGELSSAQSIVAEEEDFQKNRDTFLIHCKERCDDLAKIISDEEKNITRDSLLNAKPDAKEWQIKHTWLQFLAVQSKESELQHPYQKQLWSKSLLMRESISDMEVFFYPEQDSQLDEDDNLRIFLNIKEQELSMLYYRLFLQVSTLNKQLQFRENLGQKHCSS